MKENEKLWQRLDVARIANPRQRVNSSLCKKLFVMRTSFFILYLFITNTIFAQPPQLRPEIVEFYQLRDAAVRARVLDSTNFIEKYEAFLNHPLFCEVAFGFEYIDFADALLRQSEFAKAEKYLLKASSSHYMNASDKLIRILNRTRQVWTDTVFTIPRTPESMKFRETVLEKMLEIESKRNINPRIIAIAGEIREMVRKDQAVRRLPREDWDSVGKVDSINIFRVIELIKENPDIDIMRIRMWGGFNVVRPYDDLGDVSLLLWHQRGDTFGTLESFFLDYFRKRAEEGKGLDYCFWYDVYRYIAKREDSFYGMQPVRNNMFMFSPALGNFDEINENRAKVGLLPLWRSPR